MTDEKAVPTPVSLYPTQRAIVEAFADKTGRNFSNAIQFIIEDWARLADPEGLLLGVQPTPKARKPTKGSKTSKAIVSPDQIRGLRRGMQQLTLEAGA